MKYSLAIFDMDGTILSTLEDIADSCNEILQKYNYPLHTYDEIRFMVGNGLPKLIERALPKDTDEASYKAVLSDFIAYYKTHCTIKTNAYDGVIEVLKQLKGMGVKLAVNTNKVDSAAIELCNKYFKDLFDVIKGSRDGLPPKPFPQGVFEILDELQISKEQANETAVYIGDSDVDVQTGKNAGLNVIGAAWGFRGKEFLIKTGADNIADEPSDILKFF